MAPLNFKVTANVMEVATGEDLNGVPVVVTISDPNGNVLVTIPATTDAGGNISVSSPAPDPLPEGAYTADITFAGNAADQPADSGPIIAQVGPAQTEITGTFDIG
jgi:uncharacterized protein YfaS (alpha-2-macroglobulin family)